MINVSCKKSVTFQLDASQEEKAQKDEAKSFNGSINRRPTDGLFQGVSFFSRRSTRNSTKVNDNANILIKENHTPDLDKLSLNELKELLKRQEKLIANKRLMSKLKDNGAKAIAFRDKIMQKISYHTTMESANEMLEKLSINSCKMNETNKCHTHEILKKTDRIITNPIRLNIPKKFETTMIVPLSRNQTDFKTVSIKLDLPSQLKVLDLDTSLQMIKETQLKEKECMRTKLENFYNYRIMEEDEEEEEEEDEEEEIVDEEQFDDDYNSRDQDIVITTTYEPQSQVL